MMRSAPPAARLKVTVSGITYARVFIIHNGWIVDFEDTGTPYIVSCTGANHNIQDVTDFSAGNVSLLPNNSAGNAIVETGTSGLTSEESTWLSSVPTIETDVGTIQGDMSTVQGDISTMQGDLATIATDIAVVEGDHELIRAVEGGRWAISGSTMTFYDTDNVTPVAEFELRDSAGQPTTNPALAHERVRTGP